MSGLSDNEVIGHIIMEVDGNPLKPISFFNRNERKNAMKDLQVLALTKYQGCKIEFKITLQ